MCISFVHRGQVFGCRARAIMGWCEMHDGCCEGGVYRVHGGGCVDLHSTTNVHHPTEIQESRLAIFFGGKVRIR